MRRTGWVLAPLFVLALAAPALGITQEEFTVRADAVCRHYEKVVRVPGRRGQAAIKRRDFEMASRYMGRVAKSLRQHVAKLRSLPRPAETSAQIAGWLYYLRRSVVAFEAVIRALRADDADRLARAVRKQEHYDRLAERQNNGLGFQDCD